MYDFAILVKLMLKINQLKIKRPIQMDCQINLYDVFGVLDGVVAKGVNRYGDKVELQV